jgi:hypothetical protein
MFQHSEQRRYVCFLPRSRSRLRQPEASLERETNAMFWTFIWGVQDDLNGQIVQKKRPLESYYDHIIMLFHAFTAFRGAPWNQPIYSIISYKNALSQRTIHQFPAHPVTCCVTWNI